MTGSGISRLFWTAAIAAPIGVSLILIAFRSQLHASSASLVELGFNHFFRGKDTDGSGDQIYFQGHAAPGIYARAFLEGRIDIGHMDRFRREVERGQGLPSYPHPRLLPTFWEFPTVSMGPYRAQWAEWAGMAMAFEVVPKGFPPGGDIASPVVFPAHWYEGALPVTHHVPRPRDPLCRSPCGHSTHSPYYRPI